MILLNAVCRFIEQIIVLLITEKRFLSPGRRREVLAAITVEELVLFLES